MSFRFVLHQEKDLSVILGGNPKTDLNTTVYQLHLEESTFKSNDVCKPITFLREPEPTLFPPTFFAVKSCRKKNPWVWQQPPGIPRPITSGPVITSMGRPSMVVTPPFVAGRRCFSVETVPRLRQVHVICDTNRKFARSQPVRLATPTLPTWS